MDLDGPDLGGKVEPTRLGRRGTMTYVGSVVLAALHHWANGTPRGDERAASLNMTVQSKNIECSHDSFPHDHDVH